MTNGGQPQAASDGTGGTSLQRHCSLPSGAFQFFGAEGKSDGEKRVSGGSRQRKKGKLSFALPFFQKEKCLFFTFSVSSRGARTRSLLRASDSHMEEIVARYGSSSSSCSDDDLGCSEGDGESDREQRLARGGGGGGGGETTTMKPVEPINNSSSVPRSRSFPHVEGNYPVHVYVPVCLSHQQAQSAIELVSRVNSELQSSLSAASAAAPPALAPDRRLDPSSTSPSSSTTLHLSLSRCAPLTRPQWHSFLEALRTCLTAEEAGFAPVSGSRSTISLRGLVALANEQRATTFLALGSQRASSPSHPSSGAVAALVRAVDAAAALSGMPPLRRRHESEFVPHVSLGWVSGDEAARVGEAAAKAEGEGGGGEGRVLRELSVPIERVVCRVGKLEHVVWRAR